MSQEFVDSDDVKARAVNNIFTVVSGTELFVVLRLF
jgi:hypothetical protein